MMIYWDRGLLQTHIAAGQLWGLPHSCPPEYNSRLFIANPVLKLPATQKGQVGVRFLKVETCMAVVSKLIAWYACMHSQFHEQCPALLPLSYFCSYLPQQKQVCFFPRSPSYSGVAYGAASIPLHGSHEVFINGLSNWARLWLSRLIYV
jgi:hypothetical protein